MAPSHPSTPTPGLCWAMTRNRSAYEVPACPWTSIAYNSLWLLGLVLYAKHTALGSRVNPRSCKTWMAGSRVLVVGYYWSSLSCASSVSVLYRSVPIVIKAWYGALHRIFIFRDELGF